MSLASDADRADFQAAIDQAAAGVDLSVPQTSALINTMLRGAADDEWVGRLLLALREKGESVSELVGAAQALRGHMTRIPHRHALLLDTCGTGGSGSGTFNISTAVAMVTAACGVPVAKHGNRRASSLSGSADVLEELGVQIESDAQAVAQRLDESGICFCFAPQLHPAMKHVAGIRRRLGVKTLFNLLGPLCNPAAATHQLLGTSTIAAQDRVAAALEQLGTVKSYVVHGSDGQDEVTLEGVTRVIEVGDEGRTEQHWTAADFGLLPAGREALAAAHPAASAEIIRQLLDGQPGPCRDVVLAGTAAALHLVGRVDSLAAGTQAAAAAIDCGAARDMLESLRR